MANKLSDFQNQVFEAHNDQMGFRIVSEMLNFLHKYFLL